MDPETRSYLQQEMEKFLSNEDHDRAEGFVPPAHRLWRLRVPTSHSQARLTVTNANRGALFCLPRPGLTRL